ncbi:MAG TPA: riboflavin synthase [Candidatus Limnocylindria bacterium]|jgi:riboflavin synthase|nr:riboflavin synthase [Candidatus Limnocylindria bacterium]
MFTGIVEETGTVISINPNPAGIRLDVSARLVAEKTKLGDSIAVNGCCLTVVDIQPRDDSTLLGFDLLQETWNRTNLSDHLPGSQVNLERALAVGDRLGGHFVTGHIDGTGTIQRWERQGQDYVLDIEAPPDLLRHLVFKGCIAVDGISLTVSEVLGSGLRLWIIPHTHAATALKERHVGARVNLEADLLAKYVERLMKFPAGQ